MDLSARRLGLSYWRFSDPSQADGDSEARQARDFRAFCERHNLTPLRDVYGDRGRSGYKGHHRTRGQLGALIRAARGGQFELGTCLVVEAWDRLGRLRPDEMIELIKELLGAGMTIGVCRLNEIFEMKDFGTQKWITLSMFCFLAHQESKQKGERLAASWMARRQLAKKEGRIMTGIKPGWLDIVNGCFVPNVLAIAAIRTVFQLAASGQGQARILKYLETNKVPALGRSNRWSHNYVARLLSDRRVLGEVKLKDGTVLPAYYPAVIDEATYNLARAGQIERKGKGKRGRKLVNTFQGLLTDPLTGEGWFVHQSGYAGRMRKYLKCAAAHHGRMKHRAILYNVVETAIFDKLAEIKVEDVLPARPATSRAGVLRATLENIRRDIGSIQEDLAAAYDKNLATVLRGKTAEEERVAKEWLQAQAEEARPLEKAWEEMGGLLKLIQEHGDEARLKLRSVLASILEAGRLLVVTHGGHTLACVQLCFRGGAVRHWLIVHARGFRYRRACWKVLDFKRSGQNPLPPVPDLRNPQQARRFAECLQALDLAD